MPPKGVTLRPITDADLPLLRDLYATTRAWEMSHADWPDDQKRTFIDQQFAFQHQSYVTNYLGAALNVVELSGIPVGRLYVSRMDDELRVIDICFFPDFCGRGIGTALLTELLDEAHAQGVPTTIHVEKFNSGAKRLYQRLGFQVAEDKGVYELLTTTPPPAVHQGAAE